MPPTDTSYADTLRAIDARGMGIRPDLGRIRALLDLLGHPERAYPAVHVTGTNGKSSTARMAGSILAAHGIKTGMYTSPHLQSLRERFAVADERSTDLISPEDLAATHEYLRPFVEMVELERDEDVTYFELTTAMAFEWMLGQAVGAAVFEVGMGGAWDATNVVDAQVAVVTRVAVDHREFLGSTPLEIAREKLGIVKPGAVAVTADQDADVMQLLRGTVAEAGGELAVLGEDFAVTSNRLAVAGRALAIRGTRGRYSELFVPMHGAHQGTNAALAVAACEAFLGRALDGDALRAGLARASVPGRMEVVSREPLVVLDGAHNPAGARVLGPALRDAFGQRPTTMVVSIFGDKDAEGMLGWLVPWADRMVFAPSSSPRAADPHRLVDMAATVAAAGRMDDRDAPASDNGGRGLAIEVAPSLEAAVDAAVADAGDDGLVVVCGSLYAAGQARDHLVGPLD